MALQQPVAYRFSVEDHRIGEARSLGPDDPVELLDGEVVQMTPSDPRAPRNHAVGGVAGGSDSPAPVSMRAHARWLCG
ncbi:MAG: hypothetical protein M3Z84_03185 [Actinomycetota bacterium]|nr:hypothetical protein [Actinomycetota bacterium]